MTDEDKKLVFEYCEFKQPCNGDCEEDCITEDDKHTCRICRFYHPLDGNDMVAAMNKMVDKKEWHSFELYTADNCKRDYRYVTSIYIFWLMQPARFFELMAKWLEEQK